MSVSKRTVVSGVGLAMRAAPLQLASFVVLSVVSAAVPVVSVWLIKLVLDGLSHPGAGLPPTLLGAGLAITGLVAGLAPHGTKYAGAEIDRRTGVLAQDRLYRAVERFAGLARFEDPAFLDRLRLAEQAARTAPNQVVVGLLGVTTGVVTGLGFVGSLALISPVITGVVLVAAIPMLLAELALSRRRAGMLWAVSSTERREMFYGWLLSSVEAAKETRLFGAAGFLRERMRTERNSANAAKRWMDRRELAVQGGLGLLGAAVAGGGLIWAVRAAGAGRLTAGDVTMFVAAVAGVQGAVTSTVRQIAETYRALLMFGHYQGCVEAGPDLTVPRSEVRMPVLDKGIEFRDVWFRYGDDLPWALRGVNLHIPHGRAVALVGRNGAGKSSLVKLLCRFYDPTRGAILWDGVDLRDIPVEELRSRMCVVFQDYMCYDLTGSENIAIGDISALDHPERIERAARRAGIHQALEALPERYDTLLSRTFVNATDRDDPKTGVLLSEGQWQRLALARGLLREDRDLMILDEPSSGLDAAAEYEIHTRLREHRAGRTSLLISHRLGAVRAADHIVVLADGRIGEQGTHAQLVAAGGTYAWLFELQAEGYRDEAAEAGGEDPARPGGPADPACDGHAQVVVAETEERGRAG